ncbi:MAG: biotin--[Alloprevotella sp.]|nr:biotin--[acetyl-CoA-carboxylase] ligase [Alloprevotella sp.]
MDIELLRSQLLAFRGVTEGFPFDADTLAFKVLGKMFAVLPLDKPDRIVLKCAPAYAKELRYRYTGIQEAYHFNKTHWNEVRFPSDIPAPLILHLVRHAYAITLHGLPKKTQIAFFTEGIPPALTFRHLNVCDSTQLQVRTLEASYSPAIVAKTPEIVSTALPMENMSRYSPFLLSTDLQRAGRGQRGTHWESENGKNLLFSLLLHPTAFPANRQFILSQAAALALLDTANAACYGDSSEEFALKWPNDLYHGDHKLAGMLIEHDLLGTCIARTVIGIGLNVNQSAFHGDAPNPTSLSTITGHEHNRFLLLEAFLHHLDRRLAEAVTDAPGLNAKYHARLYRRTGLHSYRDGQGDFHAEIAGVLPDGRLQLRRTDGSLSSYAFKEVQYLPD